MWRLTDDVALRDSMKRELMWRGIDPFDHESTVDLGRPSMIQRHWEHLLPRAVVQNGNGAPDGGAAHRHIAGVELRWPWVTGR